MSQITERVRIALSVLLTGDVNVVELLSTGEAIDWAIAREIVSAAADDVEAEIKNILSEV